MQFLLELSERQAAESVRKRIDFKYALGMELEDPGFHHSVITDFRQRLAEEGRADKLLDLALEKIRVLGPVRERDRQPTDSIHVLAAVRDLTRLVLVTEAMRAALRELARLASHELVALVNEEWGQALRTRRPAREEPVQAEDPGQGDRRRRPPSPALWPSLPARAPRRRPGSGPRQIFVQNYVLDAADRPKWRGLADAGMPPSALAIVSPYDTGARGTVSSRPYRRRQVPE
ncbi:transposase [Streptomyces griseus]|uniref:transposase n=1 Tax=Streptomyces griseus TaxID=1911 RepID=UPI0037B014DE